MAEGNALGGLAGDLSFTISFAISRELLDGAEEAGMSSDELVGIVLVLGVILTALPKTVGSFGKEFGWLRRAMWRRMSGGAPKDKASSDEEHVRDPSGLTEFLKHLAEMSRRIAMSVSVQLLASNVRSKQPLRSVRIVLLLAITAYFLFVDGASRFTRSKERES